MHMLCHCDASSPLLCNAQLQSMVCGHPSPHRHKRLLVSSFAPSPASCRPPFSSLPLPCAHACNHMQHLYVRLRFKQRGAVPAFLHIAGGAGHSGNNYSSAGQPSVARS